MKQEYILVIIIGLLIFAYVLDAVVNPLKLRLATPYHFFDPDILSKYTFTTTSIIIKSIALIMAPLWFLSFLHLSKLTKGAILFVLAALIQLYALQDVASNSRVIPLEWSISLALTGAILLIPAIIYILIGFTKKAHKSLTEGPYDAFTKEDNDDL
ncbi:MAG: hypothetical protein PHE48_04295 [Candidatus Daviesbacteria bacterium]|nr:hypothetical protein [Candidatus Daviesbacteria bacterium]